MEHNWFEFFDRGIDRRNTDCEKWDGREHVFGRADVIPLWVADMDLASPPAVQQALIERAQHGAYGYTQHLAQSDRAVADWMLTRHGATIDPQWVLTSPGVVDSLRVALKLFCQVGDKVVIQPPVYGPFFKVVEQIGCEVCLNPLLHDSDGWKMNYSQLEECFQAGAKAMLLCSPHNPVGRLWTEEELSKVVKLCNQYGAALICDEIHADLELSGNKHCSLTRLQNTEKAIVCISGTKTFNLAGLRHSSVIVQDEELRSKLHKQMAKDGMCGENIFGALAQRTALEQGQPWLDALCEYLTGNMEYVYEFIAAHMPQVKVDKPEATYLMWLDMRSLGLSQEELNRLMIDKAGVGLSDGTGFGQAGTGYMRLNFAIPRRYLTQALEQMERAINSLKEGTNA